MSVAEPTADQDGAGQGAGQQDAAGAHNHRRGLLFSIALVFGLLWCGWQLLNPATLPIRQVAIEGEFRHLVPARLERSVAGVVRGGFFNVNVEKIQETLLLEPWVKHVAVKRLWPDAISVRVQERKALARWGEAGLLSAAAEFFAPAPESIPAGLPLLRGPQGSELLVMEYFHQLSALLEGSGLAVAEMRLNERRAWAVLLDNGLALELGRGNIQESLEHFARYVLRQSRPGLAQIAAVDMRYTHGFALRLKTHPSIVKTGQR